MESSPAESSDQPTRKKKFGFGRSGGKLSNVAPSPDAARGQPSSEDELPPGDERPPDAAPDSPSDSWKIARRNERRRAMGKWQSSKPEVFDSQGRCGPVGKFREFLRQQVIDPSSMFNIIVRAARPEPREPPAALCIPLTPPRSLPTPPLSCHHTAATAAAANIAPAVATAAAAAARRRRRRRRRRRCRYRRCRCHRRRCRCHHHCHLAV